HLDQPVWLHWLLPIFCGTGAQASITGSGLFTPRKDDGGNANTELSKVLQNLDATHAGHLKVEYQAIGVFQCQCIEKLNAGGVRSYGHSFCLQQPRKGPSNGSIVIQNCDMCRASVHVKSA